MNKILQALKSRTIILAIAQAVAGIAVLVFTQAEMPALALLAKSVIDIWLRADTDKALADK